MSSVTFLANPLRRRGFSRSHADGRSPRRSAAGRWPYPSQAAGFCPSCPSIEEPKEGFLLFFGVGVGWGGVMWPLNIGRGGGGAGSRRSRKEAGNELQGAAGFWVFPPPQSREVKFHLERNLQITVPRAQGQLREKASPVDGLRDRHSGVVLSTTIHRKPSVRAMETCQLMSPVWGRPFFVRRQQRMPIHSRSELRQPWC